MSILAHFLREDFRFDVAPPVVAWAEQNLVIPRSMSPTRPGPFSTRRQPTSRSILECFHPTSGVRMIANVAGSQTAKTTEGIIGLAYRIPHSPMPTLIMGPSEDWLRLEISEKRLMALINENPILARMKPFDPSRFRKMAMEMAGGTIALEGANSPVATAGSTQGIVWVEEAAKIEHQQREDSPEAHPIRLAFERTKAFRGLQLHYLSFTPNKQDSLPWQYYNQGDQTHFYVPCPHCGEYFPFEFEVKKEGEIENILLESQSEARPQHYRSLVWDPRARQAAGDWNEEMIRESTVYICPKNGCEISEEHRLGAIEKYEEHKHNPKAAKHDRSFRRPSFYSPTVTFADMALEFLRRGDLFSTGLQNFYNSWLALPWERTQHNIKTKHILSLRAEGDMAYAKGTIPRRPARLIITADPGETSGTHWLVAAVMSSAEIFVIDWGDTVGIEDLEKTSTTERWSYDCTFDPDRKKMRPARGLIDSRYATDRVYDLCARSRMFWWPTRGSDASTGFWTESPINSRPGMRVFVFVDHTLKTELYAHRIAQLRPPRIYLPTDTGPELIGQLSGQQLIDGKWKRIPNDHWGDCLKQVVLDQWIMSGFDQAPPAVH